jgi:predicted CXXCH cytochrome family protein
MELRLQKKDEAGADLAFVVKNSTLLRAKADHILTLLGVTGSVQGPKINAGLRRQELLKDDPRILAAGYAGPEACKGCHLSEYTAWKKTGMARMLQPYAAENIIGEFSPASEFQGGEVRMGFDKRPYFEIARQRFYVDYTIGSKWQQGYITKLADGRMQVLPIEYNLKEKKWINYWEMIDPSGSARAVIGDFPKLTSATNYQQNCAICHTSQLKTSGSLEAASYLQPGIDCEMCHGPSAWHAKQAAKGTLEHTDPLAPPFDFRRATNREAVQVCAQCHRQNAVREFGENGEMNYSTTGNFVPTTWMRPYDAFSRKAFYKDGRFRETTFIVEAFTRSACYLRGTAQCATCHSPHLDNFQSNKTSLKYWDKPNEMCLPCHSQYRNRIAEHSHHPAGSEASECVSCHMPRIVNALLFKARSHQIEVPSIDLTERFGQAESPNVCLTCHSRKSVAWVKDQLSGWRN